MGNAAQMKMVNGRVDARVARKAAQVLGREGLTVSSFIRNGLEHVARTGEVPECGFPAMGAKHAAGRAELKELVRTLTCKPMPGKRDFAELSDDELVERLRMERYGY